MNRRIGLFVLSGALLLLAAGSAFGQGVELIPGQTVRATLGAGDVHVYRFAASSGDSLSIRFKTGKAGDLDPEVRLFQHDATEVELPPVRGGKLSVRLALTRGGMQLLAIRGLQGTAGDYALGLRLKPVQPEPRAVPVPGSLPVEIPQGALLSGRISAARGGDLQPGVDSITDGYGNDHLDQARVSEKGGAVSIKGHGFPAPGEYRVNLVARAGSPGDVSSRIRVRPVKPAARKLGPSELVETLCARVRTAEGDSFRAGAAGAGIGAVSLHRDLQPAGTALVEVEPGEWELSGDPEDYPSGFYTLRVTFDDGSVRDFHTPVSGYLPGLPVITDTGSGSEPEITWSGIEGGVDLLRLSIVNPLSGEAVYEAVLPAGAAGHTLPAGVVSGGWPYAVELSAFHMSNSLAVATAESPGGEVRFLGAASPGDLIRYRIETGTLAYEWEILQPAPDSGGGTLEPASEWGGHAFRGGDPDQPYVHVEEDRQAFGGAAAGRLFVALPEPAPGYGIGDFAGVYNFLELTRAPGGDGRVDYGTIRIAADASFEVWYRSAGGDEPAVIGTLSDSGEGWLVATANAASGLVPFANVVVHGDPGERLLVIDLLAQSGTFDGGFGLGMERRALRSGAADGSYAVLASDEDGFFGVQISGTTFTGPEGATKLRFDWPWTGFVGTGEPGTDGGLGLLSPDGILHLATWRVDPSGTTSGGIGSGYRR